MYIMIIFLLNLNSITWPVSISKQNSYSHAAQFNLNLRLLILVLRRKPFAIELFFCWSNAGFFLFSSKTRVTAHFATCTFCTQSLFATRTLFTKKINSYQQLKYKYKSWKLIKTIDQHMYYDKLHTWNISLITYSITHFLLKTINHMYYHQLCTSNISNIYHYQA